MEIDKATEDELRRRAKAVLRKRARALRNTIPPAALAERCAKIIARLLEHASFQNATSVALFYPIEGRNEVDLRPLDATLRARGCRIAYPSIPPEIREMTFRWVDDLEAMEERGLGFRDPGDAAEEAKDLSVIVVPALQVDARGYRIGYGAGFYDRALPRFAPPATSIIVAYDFQLIPEVPVTDGDVAANAIVTDLRTIDV